MREKRLSFGELIKRRLIDGRAKNTQLPLVRLWFKPARLQPEEFVAATGATDAGRHLVADQLAAAVGENWRTLVKHARYYSHRMST